MSKQIKKFVAVCAVIGLTLALSGPAQANWSETFGGNAFDVATWQFHCYPDIAKTYTATIQDGPGDNDYLALGETSSVAVGGSAFGGCFASEETFTDVRVGAVMNVVGDASRNLCGVLGRTEYIIDDGSISGYPGIIASCYVLLVDWEDGPANLVIELQKVVQLSHIMRNSEELGLELAVPGLDHARSYYAELDILGSGPVYVTGSLYEYKGGPLVAKTATMVDTNGNDPWEDEGEHDEVFESGISGITGFNEDPEPAGYYTTFDDVFSISDGPAAVNPAPVDGATDVSINADLSWVEAAFATARDLWFGKKGAMQKVAPGPAGTTFDPGPLEFGQPYEWRVDEIGASSTVTGHTWTFTTEEYLIVDDMEDYNDYPPDRAFDTWADGYDVATNGSQVGYFPPPIMEPNIVHGGSQSMPFLYDNTGLVNYAEAVADTADLKAGQDWTKNGVKALTLHFRGRIENTEETMYVRLEDAAAKSHTVTNPYPHAVQSESWHAWDIDLTEFSAAGLNLSNVKKLCIGFGDKTGAVTCDGSGMVFFDDIGLYPARCFNLANLDLRGDVNGDCIVDFKDFSVLANTWLNDGLAVVP